MEPGRHPQREIMLKFLKRLFGSDTLPPPGEQIPTGIGYVPLIRSSRTVQAWSLGPHQAKLLTDIQALGHIEYTHALLVYDTNNALLYVVAAEVNSMASMLGGGSHFLGVFDEEGHTTHGSDNAWANLESFRDHALTMASDRFQAQPIALP